MPVFNEELEEVSVTLLPLPNEELDVSNVLVAIGDNVKVEYDLECITYSDMEVEGDDIIPSVDFMEVSLQGFLK